MTETPILRFHRLYALARPPERADRAAGGTLPTRAFRYCEALTSATGLGWYVFAPMDFSLLWDGEDVHWTCDLLDGWARLGAAQLPDMAADFDAAAPAALAGCSPPFLSALPEAGHVQVWTGLFARTRPGWSLLVRPPVNFRLPGGFASYEGIVETDRWAGPLFTNLRLTRTDVPIRFSADMPLLQVVPLERASLAAATRDEPPLGGIEAVDEETWAAYARTVTPAARPGRYAVESRKAAAMGCPFAARLPVTA